MITSEKISWSAAFPLAFCFRKGTGNRPHQLDGIDGFCQMAIKSCLQGSLAIVHTCVSGQRYHGQIRAARANECTQFWIKS
jgi:hypothetical protein